MGNFLSNIKKSPTSSSSPSILPFSEADILANSQQNEFYKFDDIDLSNNDVDISNNDVLSEDDIILTLPKPPICEPEPMIELHNSFDNVDDFLPEPQPITEETPVDDFLPEPQPITEETLIDDFLPEPQPITEETLVEETPVEETPVEETPVEETPVVVNENVPEPQPEPDDNVDTLPEPQPITEDNTNDSVLSIDLIHSDSNESNFK